MNSQDREQQKLRKWAQDNVDAAGCVVRPHVRGVDQDVPPIATVVATSNYKDAVNTGFITAELKINEQSKRTITLTYPTDYFEIVRRIGED